MAAVEADTAQGKRPSGDDVYDGFISYSHAADDLLAPRLQAGLQQFAKPWWKRRAIRLFRDESSLSANPHLWSSITDALDRSRWFVLLLSPLAASSQWVNDEISYWLEHNEADRIIPVLTEGEFGWVNGSLTGDAVPPALAAAFGDEPRWVDMRFAHREEQLDLKNPRFSAAVADIASAIRGVPKDELESEEVRQHRRTRRTAIGAGAGLLALTAAAVVAGVYAIGQREAANESAALANDNAARADESAALATSRELSLSSRGIADDDAELGVLLALEAIDATGGAGMDPLPEALSSLWHSFVRNRIEVTIKGAGYLLSAFSPDGSLLATDMLDDPGDVVLWNSTTGEEEVRFEGPEIDAAGNGSVTDIAFTSDGDLMLVSRFYDRELSDGQVSAIDVYDVSSAEKLFSLAGPPDDYGRLVVSPSRLVLVYARGAARTYIWELSSPSERVAVIDESVGYFLSDDDLVLGIEEVESQDFLFALDWRSGRRAWTHPTPVAPEVELALELDSGRVALSDRHGAMAILDLNTGEVILESNEYPDPQAMSWSPDGTALALSGNDSDVTIIDPETGDVLLVLTGSDASIFSTAWHPDGGRLASVESGVQETKIWDVSLTSPANTQQIPVVGLGPFFPIPSGGLVRSVFGGHVEVLDEVGQEVASFDHPPVFPALGRSSGDGRFVGLTTGEGTGLVIDLDTGNEVDLGCLSPRGLSWDGRFVAVDGSACDDGTPSGVYELGTTTPIIDLGDEPLGSSGFTTASTFDGREYVAIHIDSFVAGPAVPETRVEVWGLDPVELVGSIEPTTVETTPFIHALFSADGRYLGIGNSGPSAVVVDLQLMVEGAPAGEYVVFNQEVHNGNAPFAIPTSDGVLATGGFEGFYRFWDIASGERLFEIDIRDRNPSIPAHGFSGDEATFYYNQVGSIGVMPTDFDEMVDLARSSVTRSMTDDECREYLHTDGCE